MRDASERRPARRVVAAVLALLLATLPVVGERRVPARAGVPAVPGEITFTRAVTIPGPRIAEVGAAAIQYDLYRVPAAAPYDPVTRVPAIATISDEQQLVWSPDGRRFAFVRLGSDSGQYAIWVADADGTAARQVTVPPVFVQTFHDHDPSWSPDGGRLAFTRSSTGESFTVSDLRIVDVPVSGPAGPDTGLLSDPAAWVSQPTWSPDSQRIAYRAQDRTSRAAHIATIAPDGTRGPDLTAGPNDGQPAWSPDGSRLAYTAGTSIWVLTIGGGSTPLVRPSGGGEFPDYPTDPAWSPDGAMVVYTWLRGASGDIRVVPATGGTPVDVVAGSADDRQPNWRPTADLRLAVTSAPVPMRYGQPATITATVTNGGPATVRTARLRVQMPAGFSPVAVEPASCAVPAGAVACVLGPLRAGESATVTITGRPTVVAGTPTFTANVDADVVDLDPGDNRVTSAIRIAGSDLAVRVADQGVPYVLDDPVPYRVVATLRDGDGVDDAVVELRLPANVTYAGVTAPPGVTCTRPEPARLRCALPPLGFEGPDSVAFTVDATAARVGTEQGVATISSSAFDPAPDNDTATVTTRVAVPRLAITKRAPDTAVVGEAFDYELTVRNGGELDADNVVLVDRIPPGLRVVAVEPGAATCVTSGPPATLTCQLPPLAAPTETRPGQTARVRVRVAPTAPGIVTNTACVRYTAVPPSVPELLARAAPRQFEDCDRAGTDIRAGDLAVAVAAAPAVGFVGGTVAATVTVTNAGRVTVPAAVRISLPAVACETPVAGSCAARTRDVTLGPLAAGASVVVPVRLTAVTAGSAPITGRVLPATFDASPANDTATATVLVKRPTLAAVPPIGPPGFVTLGVGTDFPPGATVSLRWSAGISAPTEVRVGPDGTFRQQVLVFHHDLLGDRRLVAAGSGFTPAEAAFTVVPASLQPGDFVQRR
ncbi:hypothetical protein [Plantactinospora sp. GCM10030261]|uniref:hypothetical protein n=1 Tax=Plantactinospora sp. GCM10030261 TaxID=3273420 RepID=UPI0036128C43